MMKYRRVSPRPRIRGLSENRDFDLSDGLSEVQGMAVESLRIPLIGMGGVLSGKFG
jgi:hypothetical protein